MYIYLFFQIYLFIYYGIYSVVMAVTVLIVAVSLV